MTRRQIKEWVVIPLIVGLFSNVLSLMVEYYSGLFIVRSTSASEPSDSVNSNTSPSNSNISLSYFHLNRGDGICLRRMLVFGLMRLSLDLMVVKMNIFVHYHQEQKCL